MSFDIYAAPLSDTPLYFLHARGVSLHLGAEKGVERMNDSRANTSVVVVSNV